MSASRSGFDALGPLLRLSPWALPASKASVELRVAPNAMFPGSTVTPSAIRTTLPPS